MESNDSLYGSDPKLLSEVNKICSLVVNEITLKLQSFGPNKKQSHLALELLIKVCLHTEISNSTLTLALNLWNLALRDSSDRKYMVNIV